MEKIITGFHAIEEKVRAGKNQSNLKIFYSKTGPRVKKILEEANKCGIKIFNVEDSKLNEFVSVLDKSLQDHRGIVLKIENSSSSESNLIDFDDWIKTNANKSINKTVIILDKVTDPHNVGAILRSCDQFAVDLVVLPEHNSSNNILSNEIIARSSAGASEWVKVAIVNNLVRAVEKLKSIDFWIYGADAGGESLKKIEFSQNKCIIMGSEGSGISPLLQKQCDSIISIPTNGKIDSLNVSVASGIILYELFTRQN